MANSKGNGRLVRRRTLLMVLLVILLAAAVLTGTLIAKYTAEKEYLTQMLSSNFHISSDYLETEEAVYSVPGWNSSGIIIQLYNYEKENVAQIAEDAIEYEIRVPTGWTVQVKDEKGSAITPMDGVYTLPGVTPQTQTITVFPAADTVSGRVEVITQTPYTKTLSAAFSLVGTAVPDYVIEDQGNYLLVTVYTNNYTGNITVNWTDAFSPDYNNSRPDMSGWLDSQQSAVFSADAYTTYAMIFVKNTSASYTKTTGTGTVIGIGGE